MKAFKDILKEIYEIMKEISRKSLKSLRIVKAIIKEIYKMLNGVQGYP